MLRQILMIGAALLSFPAFGSAQGTEPDTLPSPQPLIIPAPVYQVFAPRPRYETRDVWSNYQVDSRGMFRHRVILAPFGAYYSANGEPYPWLTNHPRAVMPYATD